MSCIFAFIFLAQVFLSQQCCTDSPNLEYVTVSVSSCSIDCLNVSNCVSFRFKSIQNEGLRCQIFQTESSTAAGGTADSKSSGTNVVLESKCFCKVNSKITANGNIVGYFVRDIAYNGPKSTIQTDQPINANPTIVITTTVPTTTASTTTKQDTAGSTTRYRVLNAERQRYDNSKTECNNNGGLQLAEMRSPEDENEIRTAISKSGKTNFDCFFLNIKNDPNLSWVWESDETKVNNLKWANGQPIPENTRVKCKVGPDAVMEMYSAKDADGSECNVICEPKKTPS